MLQEKVAKLEFDYKNISHFGSIITLFRHNFEDIDHKNRFNSNTGKPANYTAGTCGENVRHLKPIGDHPSYMESVDMFIPVEWLISNNIDENKLFNWLELCNKNYAYNEFIGIEILENHLKLIENEEYRKDYLGKNLPGLSKDSKCYVIRFNSSDMLSWAHAVWSMDIVRYIYHNYFKNIPFYTIKLMEEAYEGDFFKSLAVAHFLGNSSIGEGLEVYRPNKQFKDIKVNKDILTNAHSVWEILCNKNAPISNSYNLKISEVVKTLYKHKQYDTILNYIKGKIIIK